jgi:hypothetical protein
MPFGRGGDQESTPKESQMSMTTTYEQLWSETALQAILNIPDMSDKQRDYVLRLRSSFRRAPEIDVDALMLSVEYHRPSGGHGRRVERSGGFKGPLISYDGFAVPNTTARGKSWTHTL